jgi:hypothetical protein
MPLIGYFTLLVHLTQGTKVWLIYKGKSDFASFLHQVMNQDLE